MEEKASESCSIVYFCASAQLDVYELYHKKSPPEDEDDSDTEHGLLSQIHHNVRTLLDEDQGGFDEGEIWSRRIALCYNAKRRQCS